MEIDYKVEGNILYPDDNMLTWGPFYYHSKEKAIEKMPRILDDIIFWVNLKEPTLNIQPSKVIKMETQIVFYIKAWKDKHQLDDCKGIITVELFEFED
jgi:hypothetical protein